MLDIVYCIANQLNNCNYRELMVFNAIFNNILAISWRSAFLFLFLFVFLSRKPKYLEKTTDLLHVNDFII